MTLTFERLREQNLRRCEESYHKIDDWSAERWALATFGEAGEACNALKKLIRGDGSLLELADEWADIVIYLDLWAARHHLSLELAVRDKFNKTSHKIGSEVFI